MPTKPKRPVLPTVEGIPSLVSAFSEEEYRKGIAALKYNKATDIDDVLVEQLKNLGRRVHKWLQRIQKNGLPQRSVLSPILFNIYTNDQPLHDGTRSFLYADDICVAAQYSSSTEVERTIGDALDKLTQ